MCYTPTPYTNIHYSNYVLSSGEYGEFCCLTLVSLSKYEVYYRKPPHHIEYRDEQSKIYIV